nr:Phage integrase family protein [Roseobacter litoralis]
MSWITQLLAQHLRLNPSSRPILILQANGRQPVKALRSSVTRSVDKKLPLPDAVVAAVGERLSRGKTKELPLIWRLLAGTGMRLGEAAGLTHDDLVLHGEVPHVLVRPNSIRHLKTASSNRSVPLTGDALTAAKKALEGRGPHIPAGPTTS